jgi:hypothetical protein
MANAAKSVTLTHGVLGGSGQIVGGSETIQTRRSAALQPSLLYLN